MCVYIYTYIHIMYISNYLSIYLHRYIYIHTYIYIIYVYTHTHMRTYEQVSWWTLSAIISSCVWGTMPSPSSPHTETTVMLIVTHAMAHAYEGLCGFHRSDRPCLICCIGRKKKELQVYLLSTLGQLQVYLLWLLGRSDAAPPYNRCKIGRIGTRVMQLVCVIVCNQSKQDTTS